MTPPHQLFPSAFQEEEFIVPMVPFALRLLLREFVISRELPVMPC
jgi:hypothetical protein